MSRRSSAFNDDLAGLDDLARLPLPAAEPVATAATSGVSLMPADRAAVRAAWVSTTTAAEGGGAALVADEAGQDSPVNLETSLGKRQGGDNDAAAIEQAPRRRSSTIQTAVRLPMSVAKWLSEQANRQQLTFSSVVVQAILAHRDELSPELPFGDGLLVRRRPRAYSAPITFRFTPAQLELVDGLAESFGATRSAVVLSALQVAMAQ